VLVACHITSQGIVGCVPWGVVATFLNDYLAQDRQLGVLASTFVQTLLGLGGLLGTIVGGYYGQKFYNRRPRFMSLFMGTAAIIGAIPFIVLVNLPPGQSSSSSSHVNDDGYDDGCSVGVLGGGASWELLSVYGLVSFATGFWICMTGVVNYVLFD
jgi:MFS family permease